MWAEHVAPRLALAPAVGTQLNVRRIGVTAAFAGVAVPILFGIYEVQGWQVPTPLAAPLVGLVWLMIVIAVGVIVAEVVQGIGRVREHLATSAAWISKEEPGLLDYEADGLRAVERFAKEMDGLSKDTERLNGTMGRSTAEFGKAEIQTNPKKKQRTADKTAKAIDRSAIYIERRAELLHAVTRDVIRNYRGAIEHSEFATDEDRAAAQGLRTVLDDVAASSETSAAQVRTYRQTVEGIHNQNLSRSVRIATGRLVVALDDIVKALDANRRGSRRLSDQLRKKLGG
jgi:hypothetical protein